MKKIEFDYYDWTEFEKFFDSLPTKDAVKLVIIIRKIETYGLLVAERQKWTKNWKIIYMRYVLNELLTSKEPFTFNSKIINTSSQMDLPKSRKKHQPVRKKLLEIEGQFILIRRNHR